MKGKIIVISILIVLAIGASVAILASDGYFDSNKQENVVLASVVPAAKPVLLATSSTSVVKPAVVKKATIKKKPPAKKKVVKKKKVVAKKKVNLAPPVITPETAPYSAKNRHN